MRFLQILGLGVAMLTPSAEAELPTIMCSPDSTLECTSTNGAVGVVESTVTDLDGDALMVVWMINGQSVLTNVVGAGITTNGVTLSLTNVFGHGTNEVAVGVTDDGSNVVSCASMVIVVDTTPPVIELVTATPNSLWPPNHKLKPIRVAVKASDACGPVTWKITSIESNEPVDGRGDGNTSPDWAITSAHKALVRAERAGPGNGRVYTIHVRAYDESMNFADGQVKVRVPHDRGHGRPYYDKHDFEDDAPSSVPGKGKGKGKSSNAGGNGKGKAKGLGKK